MSNKILSYLKSTSIYANSISLLKNIKFYSGEISLYSVLRIFAKKIWSDQILDRANGVAFSFTVAIFPAIIFLFTLTAYINNFIPEVNQESIMGFFQGIMPESMFTVVSSTIEDIIGNTRGGLLTFGALLSLFLATNGMMSLINAFNSCYATLDKRSYFKTRLIATALTIMLAFVLFLAIILLVLGQFALDFIHEFQLVNTSGLEFYLIIIIRFLVLFIVFFIAISSMYYFGPAVHYNWRFFSIGAILSTLFCLFISYGFSYYIANFGTYNKLYGSIGALLGLMIWQYLLSTVLLVGYEVNASIHQAHRSMGDEEY
ncbi:MAG: YihY/virulence factor BrkB family protein [Cyclobacteriaceae bacterium]|nr:YihY/virulence factor BrkB family protein [Cyclobacteriaceae bacterium]